VVERHVRLKDVLRSKHWQAYRAFCREYDRAAESFDDKLIGSWPSRAQLHRWLAGDLKGLPYPDHCLILERMLPEWTAQELFSICEPAACPQRLTEADSERYAAGVERSIASGLAAPGAVVKEWGGTSAETRGQVRAVRSLQMRVGSESPSGDEPLSELMARKVLILGQVQRLPPDEIAQLSALAGNLVDLSVTIDLNIAPGGVCEVTYRYHLLNLTENPVVRMTRDLWFQHSRGRLDLTVLPESDRNIAIQRLHSAENIAKFALQVSPPVLPGDSIKFGYTCAGGAFEKDYYWRQAVARYTRQFTLNVRHQGVGPLGGFAAIEELPDGTEKHGTEAVSWSYDANDIVMTYTLDYLRPNQYATLRWETV
jgi:hypothetical protein